MSTSLNDSIRNNHVTILNKELNNELLSRQIEQQCLLVASLLLDDGIPLMLGSSEGICCG